MINLMIIKDLGQIPYQSAHSKSHAEHYRYSEQTLLQNTKSEHSFVNVPGFGVNVFLI